MPAITRRPKPFTATMPSSCPEHLKALDGTLLDNTSKKDGR
ncbi:hypothetical protein ACFW9L_16590 [Streptomyces sp. NPDC059517]